MLLAIAGKVKTVGWFLPFPLSPKLLSISNYASVLAHLWSLIGHLPFFGHALLMKIVLSVVIFLTSFVLLKGSEYLCMVLIRIVFLVQINLFRLSFSYVLMELVKFEPLVCILYLISCWN